MILLFAASIFLFTFQNVFFKLFNMRYMKNNSSYFIFGTLTYVCICVIFLFIGVEASRFTPSMTLLSLMFGVFFISAIYFYMKAMEEGPLGLSFLFFSAGMLIPIIYGIVFYDEPAPLNKAAGLLLLFAAFYISVSGGKNDSVGRMSKKWAVYILIGLLSNGIIGVALKMYRLAAPPEAAYDFIFLGFAQAAVISLIIGLFFIFKFKEPLGHLKSRGFALVTAGAAVSTGFGNLIMLLLSMRISAIMQFPINNGALIITSILASRFIFKEDITKKQLQTIAAGLAAIVLLSL